MEQPVVSQALGFVWTLALGAGLGVLYDLLRGLRRSLRWLTPILDGLFALTLLTANVLFALTVGRGEFRLASLFGEAAGLTLWFLTLSRLFCRLSVAFWRGVTFPVRLLGRIVGVFLKKSRKKIKNLFSSARKSVTMIEARRVRHLRTEEPEYATAQIITHYKADSSDAHGVCDRDDRADSAADY